MVRAPVDVMVVPAKETLFALIVMLRVAVAFHKVVSA